MQTTFKREKSSRVRTTTIVASEERQNAESQSLQKIAATISVKGFRPGKAPIEVVRARINPEEHLEETIRTLLPDVLRNAFEKSDAKPVLRPAVKVQSVDPLTIEILFVEKPQATLKKPGSIMIQKKKPEHVTDKDVETFIEKIRRSDRRETPVDRNAQNGDVVQLTMKATDSDGKEVAELTTKYNLELGSDDLLSELSQHVIGMKRDEKKTVTITFDAKHDIHGIRTKKVTIDLTVLKVSETTLPELNEAFLSERLHVQKTPEAFQADVRTMLENKRLNDEIERREDELYAQVRDHTQVDLPDELIEAEAKDIFADFEERLTSQGIKLADWLTINEKKPETVLGEMKDAAKKRIVLRLGMQEFARWKKINPSSEEIEKSLEDARKDAMKGGHPIDEANYEPGGAVYEYVVMSTTMSQLVRDMVKD